MLVGIGFDIHRHTKEENTPTLGPLPLNSHSPQSQPQLSSCLLVFFLQPVWAKAQQRKAKNTADAVSESNPFFPPEEWTFCKRFHTLFYTLVSVREALLCSTLARLLLLACSSCWRGGHEDASS